MTPERWTSNGHPVALDPDAISTDPDLPAFMSPPQGAPAYYGFPLMIGIESDGFKLGIITDFTLESDVLEGDLYIVAPDGSRAGIVWVIGPGKRYGEYEPATAARWGVWQFEFSRPLRTIDDTQWALDQMVLVLRPEWERWAESVKQVPPSTPTFRRLRRLPTEVPKF
jgi:hypothetical protein